jgi:hypothetical protein
LIEGVPVVATPAEIDLTTAISSVPPCCARPGAAPRYLWWT